MQGQVPVSWFTVESGTRDKNLVSCTRKEQDERNLPRSCKCVPHSVILWSFNRSLCYKYVSILVWEALKQTKNLKLYWKQNPNKRHRRKTQKYIGNKNQIKQNRTVNYFLSKLTNLFKKKNYNSIISKQTKDNKLYWKQNPNRKT